MVLRDISIGAKRGLVFEPFDHHGCETSPYDSMVSVRSITCDIDGPVSRTIGQDGLTRRHCGTLPVRLT